jgi:hypothetical protein
MNPGELPRHTLEVSSAQSRPQPSPDILYSNLNLPQYQYTAEMADHHDDLHAEQTEGFKVGEKKTIDEYQKLGTSPSPPNTFAKF